MQNEPSPYGETSTM